MSRVASPSRWWQASSHLLSGHSGKRLWWAARGYVLIPELGWRWWEASRSKEIVRTLRGGPRREGVQAGARHIRLFTPPPRVTPGAPQCTQAYTHTPVSSTDPDSGPQAGGH